MSQDYLCSHGCSCCSQRGDGARQTHDGGCCHSTICDSYRWEQQCRDWIRAESKWKRENDPEITRWLIAETLWKANIPAWLEAEDQYKVDCQEWLDAKEDFRRQMRGAQAALKGQRTITQERKGRAKQTSATVAAQVALQKVEAGGHSHP